MIKNNKSYKKKYLFLSFDYLMQLNSIQYYMFFIKKHKIIILSSNWILLNNISLFFFLFIIFFYWISNFIYFYKTTFFQTDILHCIFLRFFIKNIVINYNFFNIRIISTKKPATSWFQVWIFFKISLHFLIHIYFIILFIKISYVLFIEIGKVWSLIYFDITIIFHSKIFYRSRYKLCWYWLLVLWLLKNVTINN